MPDHEINSREREYQKTFDAWSTGNPAYALELSRALLHDFPGYNIGLVLQGVILYELARYDEAEQVLHTAVQDLPSEALHHGFTHLGHLCREKGDYTNAEKWYRKAIKLDPSNAGRHVFLGALLAKKGDFSGAEAVHRDATQCREGPVDEAYLNLGLILRAQERYKEALACFQRALELTPEYSQAIAAKNDLQGVLAYLRTGE